MASQSQAVAQYYALISKDVQLLRVFEYLVDNKKGEISPIFDIVVGYHYPDITKAVNIPAKESIELAKKIVSLGLGAEEYHEQVIRCPYCTSEYATIRFHCPFCNSTKLAKEVLIEHSGDGTIAPISSFKKGASALTCPVCKRALVQEGKDYRTVGVWYSCLSCSKQFDTPKGTYLCLSCSKEFTTQELIITSVNKITIDRAILQDFSKRHLILRPLVNAISEMGMKYQTPGVITGKSGYQHGFNVVGIDASLKEYAFDVVIATTGNYVDEAAVLNMFAKVLDTKPEQAFLICMPSIVENGKKIAAIYNINIIEGKSMDEVMSSLRKALSTMSSSSAQASAVATEAQGTSAYAADSPKDEAKPATDANPENGATPSGKDQSLEQENIDGAKNTEAVSAVAAMPDAGTPPPQPSEPLKEKVTTQAKGGGSRTLDAESKPSRRWSPFTNRSP